MIASLLVFLSGKDQLLPSEEEGQRLFRAIPKCENRRFNDSGHFLLLEDGNDLATIIKGSAAFYRRGICHDYVSDYIPPTPSEVKKLYELSRLSLLAASAVMLSTLEDGNIVKGLAGIPSDGPVLYVGYHMLMGHELVPMVSHMLLERNILLRGLAHPLLFMRKKKEGSMPPLSDFESMRVMGAVPVSGTNLFKLLSSKAHVLLYPGGAREAAHRKGEQYKLFWPEQSEFVRTAARFGAKIVPFGVVGEDDFGEVVFDYDDQMKIPWLREDIRRFTEEEGIKVRAQKNDAVGDEDMHYPWVLPKFPGRFYYYFGKPIETEGRKLELRDKDKAQELYLEIKHEVEKYLAFLKEKRESDPYRNIVARLAYQAMNDGGDGGPPRWFSPLECGSRSDNSPLLLFLPGIDGTGLGLSTQHNSLGKIFDIWCLHIPVKDRTSFLGLVKLTERTVRSESYQFPNRPIYLVGESLGACLALAVAARNPDVDLVLVLANPATSFEKSRLQPLIPLLEVLPFQHQLTVPYILSLMTGDSLRMAMDNAVKGFALEQTIGGLSQDLVAMSSYLNALANILPRETLLWKLQMLKTASAYTNSRLHAVKCQTLVLSSGKDQLLPSEEEGHRLYLTLPKCENRKFNDSGHFLFLEHDVDLVNVIKGASFYRRGKYLDYISDYIPPTPPEFKKLYESYRLFMLATSPVMLSSFEDGKIMRGLAGVPSEGPVLFVGYHMLMGTEVAPLISNFLLERNILIRGIAHPMMFVKLKKEGLLPPLSQFDAIRSMGAVPVSGSNFFKLMSSKAHALLYPGGMREACHRKGEQYKLFWPEQSEFVRMAARFGAKIVPFGAVGEDDFGEVVFDYDDQMKIPFLRDYIKQLSEEAVSLRTEAKGEVGQQEPHRLGIAPKFPGRFYYYFGKPIETEGMKQELRDREKAHELYLQVKSEVENCIAFLKEKRETDPYRNILTRLAYQASHGFDAEVPTFEL
ncbi:unnamed protein product [Dovyalis caffra]|uniref:Serine aminopeptidase S33 domain-containing protein n=1 Tax=Dovyalis caffra TaxID=77055 RepID=A0AAV1R5T8_9ROSI|nr:unnamed protein product [Dovyalis caffra]